MKERLKQLVDIKAGGRQREFAKMLGWSPQYLCKLLKAGSIGLQPVQAILTKWSDIDARWLILGEGTLYNNKASMLDNLLAIEKYICVMSQEEQEQLAKGIVDVSAENIKRWDRLLRERDAEINRIFAQAYKSIK